MIDETTIAQATELLREAAAPEKIILFGSYARNCADSGSDFDLLVVESAVSDAAAEMIRLMRVLSPLRIPADVLVVSRQDFADWSGTPGHILFEAAREGVVLYEAARTGEAVICKGCQDEALVDEVLASRQISDEVEDRRGDERMLDTVIDGLAGSPVRLRRYAWALAAFWTVAIAIVLAWRIWDERNQAVDIARSEATGAWKKEAAMIRWAAGNGRRLRPRHGEDPARSPSGLTCRSGTSRRHPDIN